MGSRNNVKDSRHGLGSYILLSEFGIYKGKDADNYSQENVYLKPKKNLKLKV